MDYIRIKGASQHNLKNITIDIPRDKLVIITGVSGSGKSSLAFDTIYAEGQRRYVESLSAYALWRRVEGIGWGDTQNERSQRNGRNPALTSIRATFLCLM